MNKRPVVRPRHVVVGTSRSRLREARMITGKKDMLAEETRGKLHDMKPVSHEDLHKANANDLVLKRNEKDAFVFCHACREGIT